VTGDPDSRPILLAGPPGKSDPSGREHIVVATRATPAAASNRSSPLRSRIGWPPLDAVGPDETRLDQQECIPVLWNMAAIFTQDLHCEPQLLLSEDCAPRTRRLSSMHRLLRFLTTLPARVRKRLQIRRLTRRLTASTGFYFTADYVSPWEDTWEHLMEAYKGHPGVQILEIGSYEGRSTVWFLTNVVTHPTARITCIDPFWHMGQRLIFDHNIAVSGGSNRTSTIVGTSADVLHTLPEQSFDIVYVDGSHRAADVLLDALTSWRILKRGGILLFDDYGWHPEKPLSTRPRLAIDLFLETFGGEYDLLLKDYQVAVRKR